MGSSMRDFQFQKKSALQVLVADRPCAVYRFARLFRWPSNGRKLCAAGSTLEIRYDYHKDKLSYGLRWEGGGGGRWQTSGGENADPHITISLVDQRHQ